MARPVDAIGHQRGAAQFADCPRAPDSRVGAYMGIDRRAGWPWGRSWSPTCTVMMTVQVQRAPDAAVRVSRFAWDDEANPQRSRRPPEHGAGQLQQRVLRSPVTRKGVCMMHVPSDGGPQTDAALGLLYKTWLLLGPEPSRDTSSGMKTALVRGIRIV